VQHEVLSGVPLQISGVEHHEEPAFWSGTILNDCSESTIRLDVLFGKPDDVPILIEPPVQPQFR